MRRAVALVGMCLLFGLVTGLVSRPDDGTQVSISPPTETGAALSGANYGKTRPRVPTPDLDLVRQLLALSALGLAMVTLFPSFVAATRDDVLVRPRWLLLARAVPRRGPPARA